MSLVRLMALANSPGGAVRPQPAEQTTMASVMSAVPTCRLTGRAAAGGACEDERLRG